MMGVSLMEMLISPASGNIADDSSKYCPLNPRLTSCRPHFPFRPHLPVCSYKMNWHDWGNGAGSLLQIQVLSNEQIMCIHRDSSYAFTSFRPAWWSEGFPASFCTVLFPLHKAFLSISLVHI